MQGCLERIRGDRGGVEGPLKSISQELVQT